MSQKNGPIIHVERGYQIAEVVEGEGRHSRFIGYRLIGPGADELSVFLSEGEAKFALVQLLRRHGARDST